MSRIAEERARREKLVIVAKKFWMFFVVGVFFIFIGVILVAVGNSVQNYGIRVVGLFCGCCGIVTDALALFYLTVQKGCGILPPWCCNEGEGENSLRETEGRDLEGRGSIRSSNFERPPSYRTCLKMRSPDSPPSYTEVILSITKTDENGHPTNDSGLSSDENIQPTNENTQSTNEISHLTNENGQMTNENEQSTNENIQSTNENSGSANENSESTNENSESTNENSESTNENSESTNENSESTNENEQSAVENMQSTNENTELVCESRPSVNSNIPPSHENYHPLNP